MRLINLCGRTFGRVTVLGRDPRYSTIPRWRCKCSCGTVFTTVGARLRYGVTKSCGCYRREFRAVQSRGERPLCACGCGKRVSWSGAGNKWRRWMTGHSPGRKGVLALSAHPNWKGGIVNNGGRIRVKAPDHPRASKAGYVYRYVLVAEQTIGRLLRKGEEVHHINGNKSDDSPENLQVLTKRAHAILHEAIKRHRRLVSASRQSA